MSEIACCYLTHNHPDTIKDILSRSLDDYMEHNIDICVFDDSTDDETLRIIESFWDKGANGLYYVDAHEAQSVYEKMIMILKGCGLPKDYKYIWPSKDRVCFSAQVLDRIIEAANAGYDVIQVADEFQRWDVKRPTSRDVYTDAGEFYRDYMVYFTNWEGTIRRYDTLLQSFDWDGYMLKYGVGYMNEFIHPMSLIAGLLDAESFTASIVRFEKSERYISDKSGSAWENQVFWLWIDAWLQSNYALPSSLDPYKFDAIRSQTGLPELFGSVGKMIMLSKKELYNEEIFAKYKNLWPFITDIPVEWLEQIALGKLNEVINETKCEFERALKKQDFLWALKLISSNSWFAEFYDAETYNILNICFYIFKQDMIRKGYSHMFDGVETVSGIIDRYEHLQIINNSDKEKGNII